MKREAKLVLLAVLLGLCILVLLLLTFRSDRNDLTTADDSAQTVIELVYAYQNSQWNGCVEEVIRRFEEANPHIDVQYEIRYEDTVYEDLLFRLAARDELGDVVQIKEPYAWAESGLIAPLPNSLTEQVGTVCSVDGKTYGVCALGNTTGIVYNRDLFDRLGLSTPGTYDEFIQLCRTLKENGITPLGVGGMDLWHFEYWLNHFLRADVLSAEPDFLAQCSAGKRDWSNPLITTMLAHLNELFSMGFVDERWPSTPDGSMAHFLAEEQVAMVFSGPWLITDALTLDPDMDLGWFYMPNAEGRVIAGDSLDVFWTVSASCAEDPARYEAAVSFLNYFYSQDIYEETYTSMAALSTRKDDDRNTSAYDDTMQQVILAHDSAEVHLHGYVGDENTPPGFEKRLLTILSRMCAGELTVQQTQTLANQFWQECLAQEVAYAQ